MGPKNGRWRWVMTGPAKWLLLLVAAVLALGLITPVICRSTPGTPMSQSADWSA